MSAKLKLVGVWVRFFALIAIVYYGAGLRAIEWLVGAEILLSIVGGVVAGIITAIGAAAATKTPD